jgi:hypothetical protein
MATLFALNDILRGRLKIAIADELGAISPTRVPGMLKVEPRRVTYWKEIMLIEG